MSDPVLQVRGLRRTYGGPTAVDALRGIDLSVNPGELVAVMGPSGSGKTTLLNLICGLDEPTAGEVIVEGRALSGLSEDERTILRRRRLGVVFQTLNLVDVLTAEENAALPLVIDGVKEREAHTRAREALAWVGLKERMGHLPGELSGGEQQRVAIARALAIRPAVMLCDEPTGNLDSVTGDQVIALLRRVVDEQRQAVLLVTHDARHAARADRLLRLRDGVVIEEQRLPPAERPLSELLGELEED